jgi:hypothetical protein
MTTTKNCTTLNIIRQFKKLLKFYNILFGIIDVKDFHKSPNIFIISISMIKKFKNK